MQSPVLTSEQRKQMDDLKNLIVHGTPLDSKHPGVLNLSPDQKRHLIAMEKKQSRSQPLRPAEEEKLGQYKTLIAHGQPIDSSHPGMVNLTEHEKDKFIEFEDRGGEDMLTPEERVLEEKLRNEIVNGVPLDNKHQGMQNLSPI